MKNCTDCGRENQDDATYCCGCGAELRIPTSSSCQPPKVVMWFKVYSGVLCLVYAALALFSLYLVLAGPADLTASEERGVFVVLFIMSLPLFGACLLPLVLRPRPWLWTYDLVIICLGMTSACFLPACIPLLIFWLKP